MEYKGFTITYFEPNSYYVEELGKGYATESAAKVAITKHIKAEEKHHEEFWDDVSNMAREDNSEENTEENNRSDWTEEDQREQDYFDRWTDITLPSQETLDSPSIPVPAGLSREEMREFIISHADKPQQSRNKREGFFSGVINGKKYRVKDNFEVWSSNTFPKNRKQCKAAKIQEKNSQQELDNMISSLQKGCIYDYQ